MMIYDDDIYIYFYMYVIQEYLIDIIIIINILK